MGLYIKGVDMPKTEYEEVIIRIKHTGEVCDAQNIHLYAQATEIPTPHGDLIDRDTVRDECYKTMEELMQSTTINISAEALSLLCGFTIINNAPTILEAEE